MGGKDAESLTEGSVPDGAAQSEAILTEDAVFGIISEDGPNYRNVCTILVVEYQQN